jgi:hypothetical protein
MRQRAKSFESVSDGSGESSVKLSVNVSGDIGQRLRRIAFEERLSESSIVQIALTLMFAQTSDSGVGAFLKEQGASLRRGVRS